MKPASIKAKGRTAENLWVQFLQDNGFIYAERRRLTGAIDHGDVTGTPGITWEVKNHKTYAFPDWMEQLDAEQQANSDPIGVLVVKPRRQSNPADWWCVISPATLITLLRDAGYIADD